LARQHIGKGEWSEYFVVSIISNDYGQFLHRFSPMVD
jgi:hypothetical protein